MVVVRFSCNLLQETGFQGGKDPLEEHEGVLSSLGFRIDICQSIIRYRDQRDDAIVVEEALIGDHSVNVNWDIEDSAPTLNFRFGLE